MTDMKRHVAKPQKAQTRGKAQDSAGEELKSLADRLAAAPFVQKLMRHPGLGCPDAVCHARDVDGRARPDAR